MIPKLRKGLGGALICGIALMGLARMASAQDSAKPLPSASSGAASTDAQLGAPQGVDAALLARIEKLERQNQELMHALQNVTTHTGTAAPAGDGVGRDEVQKIVADYVAAKDADQAAAKKADSADGYKIGSDMSVKAYFNENGYLWLTTPNKDFAMHIGYWLQWDNVFWNQSSLLRLAPGARPGHAQGVASGIAAGGIGDLQDGEYFRRIRPFLEGNLWETYEYRINLALENNQFATAGLDEVWIGDNYLPVIGTVRFGHVKTMTGFEADMTGSSRTMTFLERSSYSEAIELNQNFVTGVWQSNNFFNQHMTINNEAFRVDNGQSSGAFFGDGQWGAGTRWTFNPIYDCEGRHWLHLGVSAKWLNGTTNLATSPDRTFQLRARDELRDDDPAAQTTQPVPNANDNRMVDTGLIAARNDYILGLELCYVRGPFSVQAEYGWNFLDGAFGVAPAGLALNPAIVPPQDYVFSGGYVQLAYNITGEARAYDRKYGTLAREYFVSPGNLTNAWLTRDENGKLNWGWGAWELAARYSYINLNDGTGTNRIQGGVMNGLTLGLNWYLNNNIKWNFDYVWDQRSSVPTGTIPGQVTGFGTRIQLSF